MSHRANERSKCIKSINVLYFFYLNYLNFINNIFSFPHLDTMTVAASEVVKAMRKHEKSLSVQLEALRVLLHFMMPGKSFKNIIGVTSYVKSENLFR